MPSLGRLQRVDLRGTWAREDLDFTPWLAGEANLGLLGETLGLDLELEAQERNVGPFRADILCKDIGNDSWVLIENQLERTDHTHLGQLMTYAAGLNAETIIWIASTFTEEHRAALDWLNRITDEKFRFFGLEIELWRVDDSVPAPKFNIVSKPNNWSRSVEGAARKIDTEKLSELRQTQLDYWAGLNLELDRQEGFFSGNRKPQPQSWMSYPAGRSRFHIGAVMLRQQRAVRVELYINGPQAKAFFDLLERQRETIEADFGKTLNWERLDDKQDARITTVLNDADPEDLADWSRQHTWLAENLNAMRQVFEGPIRGLNAEDWEP